MWKSLNGINFQHHKGMIESRKRTKKFCQAFEYFLINFYYLLVEHFCSDNENKNDGKHMTSTFNNVFQ